MTTAQQYLDVLRSQLGQGETPPGSNITKYGAYTGYNGQPWCGSFQLWCANEAGLTLPVHMMPALVYTPAGANVYRSAGLWSDTPTVGAHVFYDWNGDGTIDHVECVESILADGSLITIGGNVDNLVQRVHRSRQFVVGFGHPVYSLPPTPPPPPPPPAPSVPRVSLSHVIAAAKHDAPAAGTPKEYATDVLPVEKALEAEHLLSSLYVDGSFGTKTIQAYSAWQKECGFSGSDADGIPGVVTLKKLGARHGFVVVA